MGAYMLPTNTESIEPLNPHAHWRSSHCWCCSLLGLVMAFLVDGEGMSSEIEPIPVNVDGIRCKFEPSPVDGKGIGWLVPISLHEGQAEVEECCIRS
jgi:hypothetical protein